MSYQSSLVKLSLSSRKTLHPVRTLEYLSIMKIKDDQGRVYIVTGYDNDDLSQDPQVIDVFPLEDFFLYN